MSVGPGEPLVVEAVRSGFVESEHLLDVAVTDASGALTAFAGDPDRRAAFRSSAKPIQAAVAREAGWRPEDDRALAIACASHNGEPGHVEAVRALLAHAGVDESSLACPPGRPFRAEDVAEAGDPHPIFYNCSGKHAALLAACVAAGWPLEGYVAADHPLQQAIAARVAVALGVAVEPLIDGCGIPTFVAPLNAFARAFGGVAGTDEARAMRAHPWLVGGTERLDTDLMASADVLSKGGAEGLVCATAGGVAIAIKSRDGAARACGPALIHVLITLGLLDEAAAPPTHREPAVLGGGRPVGVLRARGSLRSA